MELKITGGVTLIDDADFDLVCGYTWHVARHSSGRRGGFSYVQAYSRRGVNQYSVVLMHRVILQAARGQMVDHRNGEGLDNRRSNIRLCSPLENQRNTRAILNASGYKCVFYEPRCRLNPYRARIGMNGRRIELGNYPTAELAAEAYDRAAVLYFGEFAATNEELLKGK